MSRVPSSRGRRGRRGVDATSRDVIALVIILVKIAHPRRLARRAHRAITRGRARARRDVFGLEESAHSRREARVAHSRIARSRGRRWIVRGDVDRAPRAVFGGHVGGARARRAIERIAIRRTRSRRRDRGRERGDGGEGDGRVPTEGRMDSIDPSPMPTPTTDGELERARRYSRVMSASFVTTRARFVEGRARRRGRGTRGRGRRASAASRRTWRSARRWCDGWISRRGR